jgi:hypothetical protein
MREMRLMGKPRVSLVPLAMGGNRVLEGFTSEADEKLRLYRFTRGIWTVRVIVMALRI